MQIRSRALGAQSGHEAGRALLAEMYREHTGRPLPKILLEARGKPYFAQGTLHFSISHTNRRVFCALSSEPVGIDAEEIDRKIDLRLADKILSPGEKVQFHAAQDKRMALLRFWVLKEASVKYSGEGLRGYPCNTAFSLEDPRIFEMDGCLVAVVQA